MTPVEVRQYQLESGLVPDGILGPITQSALNADAEIPVIHRYETLYFRGSMALTIQGEGFRGQAYWPGGSSGVTLDYGWDLGYGGESVADLRRLYGKVWGHKKIDELAGALDLRGPDARDWLRGWKLGGANWEISRAQASYILPYAALPYWEAAVEVCAPLRFAPPRVQTAFLSVTYSSWTTTARAVRRFVEREDWRAVANYVREAPGDFVRREREARFIETIIGEG